MNFFLPYLIHLIYEFDDLITVFLQNQMLELQSQPTPEGSQPLSGDEICETVLDKRPGYSKGLSWGPRSKSRAVLHFHHKSKRCTLERLAN